ncbi:hypothetical protein C8Q80DRAFT_1275589 [Daedaleopsis nitida]|nr:hypothetical protein C8Q80DRAFT_1275589 [Daedaleopsis nitida]
MSLIDTVYGWTKILPVDPNLAKNQWHVDLTTGFLCEEGTIPSHTSQEPDHRHLAQHPKTQRDNPDAGDVVCRCSSATTMASLACPELLYFLNRSGKALHLDTHTGSRTSAREVEGRAVAAAAARSCSSASGTGADKDYEYELTSSQEKEARFTEEDGVREGSGNRRKRV